MEDDQIKDLFSQFRPELSSGRRFISRVQSQIAAIEAVKAEQRAMIARQKRALAIAAVVGMVVGVAVTLLVIWLGDGFASLRIPPVNLPLSFINLTTGLTVDLRPLLWLIAAGAVTITAINAYTLALARQKGHQEGGYRK